MRQIVFSCHLLVLLWLTSGFQVASGETAVVSQMHLVNGKHPDFVELTVADQSVPALYRTDQSGRHYGAVLLLHDKNGAIDSSGPLTAMRQLLPEHGWSVMTVALSHQGEKLLQEDETELETNLEDENAEEDNPSPDTNDEAEEPTEAAIDTLPVADIQRIQAAVMHMQTDNPQQLIVAGVGAGALQAIQAIATLPVPAAGLVIIQTPTLDDDGQSALSNTLVPILDITMARAPGTLQKAARSRAATMKRIQHAGYSQRRLAGTDAQNYAQRELIAIMTRNWLYQRYIAPERTP